MKRILLPLEETERSLKAVHYIKKNYDPSEVDIILLMADEKLGFGSKTEAEAEATRELEEKLNVIADSLEGYKVRTLAATGKAGVRITRAAKETGAIVTAEEHSIIGGLGGAVAEVLSESCPVPVLRLGVEDAFGRSGPAVKLLHLFGLDAAHIAAKAKQAVALKK